MRNGIPSKLQRLNILVDNTMIVELLNEKIGLGVLDFTQSMDHQPFTVESDGLALRRLAAPSAQSPEITDWGARLFASAHKAQRRQVTAGRSKDWTIIARRVLTSRHRD